MNILRSWYGALRALFNVIVVVIRLFVRYPGEMIHVCLEYYLGDRQKAGELFRKLDQREAKRKES